MLGLASLALAGCGEGAAAGHSDDVRSAPTAVPAAPQGFPDLSVPEPGADVEVLELDVSTLTRPVRLLLDAGHGAADNAGNTSSFGVAEQDFTLDLALDVAAQLESTGGFEVRLSRRPGESIAYPARVAAARAMGADAFVSLHSDVRGTTRRWSPVPGVEARASVDAPGFSVLFADEGDAALVQRRRGLAVAVAREMGAAGFFPYGGTEYEGLYAADAGAAGAFVDRHEDAKRIFVLRRTPMPAVIVETHNALDPREAARWDEAWHRRAFAMALARGLADAILAPTGPAAVASPG